MIIKIKRETPALQLWREIPKPPKKEERSLLKVRGNMRSKIILMGPVPSDGEYQSQVPFSDPAALAFDRILKDEGLATERDFFIVPCVRWGEKALQRNTDEVRNFLLLGLKQEVFDFVISVGEDPTRWIVNGGRKTNMGNFGGQLVYPPNLFHKPLFIFSESRKLVPEMIENSRENFFRQRVAERMAGEIQKQAARLLTALKGRK